MKGVPVQAGRHACMNCAVPMHGGLCSHEYPDGLPEGVNIELLVSRLSQHGQHMTLQDRNDSLLCFICLMRLLPPIVANLPQVMGMLLPNRPQRHYH